MPTIGLTVIIFVMAYINKEALAKLETDLPNAYNYAFWDLSLWAFNLTMILITFCFFSIRVYLG